MRDFYFFVVNYDYQNLISLFNNSSNLINQMIIRTL